MKENAKVANTVFYFSAKYDLELPVHWYSESPNNDGWVSLQSLKDFLGDQDAVIKNSFIALVESLQKNLPDYMQNVQGVCFESSTSQNIHPVQDLVHISVVEEAAKFISLDKFKVLRRIAENWENLDWTTGRELENNSKIVYVI